MTENKRFNYVLGDGFTDYMMHLTATEVCDLLNELYDENQRWENLSVEDRIQIERLEEENEQLKKEINMLKITIGRNEGYIQRMKYSGELR